MTIKAFLTTQAVVSDDVNRYRKEKNFFKQYTIGGVKDGKPLTVATIKCYRTKSTVTAIVWLPLSGRIGVGRASGYGYAKLPEALSRAFESAGVAFNVLIYSLSDSDMEEAMKAIASDIYNLPKISGFVVEAGY